jgi:Lar family restriction alleviation protein
MDNEKLIPCPFCGGKVIIFQNYQKQYGVFCSTCGLIAFMGCPNDRQKTAEKWNERVTDER